MNAWQRRCPVPSWPRTPRLNTPWTVSSGPFTTSWPWRRATCPSPYARWGSSIRNRPWIKSGRSSLSKRSAMCWNTAGRLAPRLTPRGRWWDSGSVSCRGYTDVPAYPAPDAALNIIVTGATRQPELFYPWFTRALILSKDWFPSFTDYVIQNSYNYTPWILYLMFSTTRDLLWMSSAPSDFRAKSVIFLMENPKKTFILTVAHLL